MNYEQIILSRVVDYCKLAKWQYNSAGKIVSLKCPFCQNPHLTAQAIPNTYQIKCYNNDCQRSSLPEANQPFTILSILRVVEPDKNDRKVWTKEKLLHHLKEKLKVRVLTAEDYNSLSKQFDKLISYGWNFIPAWKGSKKPISGRDSTDDTVGTFLDFPSVSKKKEDIFSWIELKLNVSAIAGKESGFVGVDVDLLSKEEYVELLIARKNNDKKKVKELEAKLVIPSELKKMLGETLTVDTGKGFHFFYQYDPEFRKGSCKFETVMLDYQTDGSLLLLPPSVVNRYQENEGKKTFVGVSSRQFINTVEPTKMSDKLKEFLRGNLKKEEQETAQDKEIEQMIANEDFKVDPKDLELKNDNLKGCCNKSFVALAGVYSKFFPANEVEKIMHITNKHLLAKPMESQSVTAMCREVNRYRKDDFGTFANKVVKHLKDIKTATKTDIEFTMFDKKAVGEDKKLLDKTIAKLLAEGIIRRNRHEYEIVEQLDWTDSMYQQVKKPINFKMPYLHDVMNFKQTDLILIGADPKSGKSFLAMNFVQRLVQQGIKPCYIYNEKQGGRFLEVAYHLGLKDGDFWFPKHSTRDPFKLILKPNSVTIYDWVNQSKDFSQTAMLFESLVNKTEDTVDGTLICFVQLRDGEFYAKYLLPQFPALVCRYFREENTNDKGYFLIDYVRGKGTRKVEGNKIPTKYFAEDDRINRIDELEENQIKEDSTSETISQESEEDK